ncbi:hypothetical protein F4804DRAFT_315212 [Jackrogersella minutella]|nr:hypothetical protein F4804DRAFT_315212 [Jackrogersella minutella]
MALKLTYLVWLVGGLVLTLATPIANSHQFSFPLPSRTLVQMNQTDDFIENIAVRGNGDLLVTLFHPSASVYTVRRPFSKFPTLSLVHTFQDANSTTGITETNPDTFVVAAAFMRGPATPCPNTTSFWELKFGREIQEVEARRIMHAPQAGLINGIASIPGTQPAVLAADGLLGLISRVDVTTGRYEIVLDIPELKPVAGRPLYIGANGLKVQDGFVYWSNTGRVSLYRFRIDDKGYPIKGSDVEKVATVEGASGVDDFAFDKEGNIWVATDINNTIVTIRKGGFQTVAVGSTTELTVGGDTAVGFGRTLMDKHILYVTTAGGAAAPINGTIIEPGKIVAVDTTGITDSAEDNV